MKWANPFVLGLLEKVPSSALTGILIVLIIIIGIDTVISFVVIGNFKRTAKQVEKEIAKDSTEEISNMVKEVATRKAEEIKDTIQLNVKIASEKAHYTREKAYSIIKEKVEKSQKDIQNAIQDRITTTKEFTELVKERFSKTWLNRRFLRAFPNLQVKSKIFRLNENNKKEK